MSRMGIVVVSLLLPFMAGVANAGHNYQHRPNEVRSSNESAIYNAQARWMGPGVTRQKTPLSNVKRYQRNF